MTNEKALSKIEQLEKEILKLKAQVMKPEKEIKEKAVKMYGENLKGLAVDGTAVNLKGKEFEVKGIATGLFWKSTNKDCKNALMFHVQNYGKVFTVNFQTFSGKMGDGQFKNGKEVKEMLQITE